MHSALPYEVTIRQGNVSLGGSLCLPANPQGVVIFAHGSGSGRFSPRNQLVARHLEAGGFATLLMDLLDAEEADDRKKVFDIDLLADRLLLAQDWLATTSQAANLRCGYFGASTGAGAALQAAARRPQQICAVVSRGGRPDLAGSYLSQVVAPTLLLVGGMDGPVIEMNRQAISQLTCLKELVIIPGAGHLFEERNTLEQVAEQALHWFRRHLPSHSRNEGAPR
jgi:putative phosphoribosyl transferase